MHYNKNILLIQAKVGRFCSCHQSRSGFIKCHIESECYSVFDWCRYISFRYILPSDRGKPHLHLVKKGELNHLKWIIAIQSNICSHWQSNPISHFNKLYYSIFAIHANTDSISYCSTIRFGRCSYIFHISMHLKLLTTASISYRVQSVKFVIIKLMFVSPFFDDFTTMNTIYKF